MPCIVCERKSKQLQYSSEQPPTGRVREKRLEAEQGRIYNSEHWLSKRHKVVYIELPRVGEGFILAAEQGDARGLFRLSIESYAKAGFASF